MIEESYHEKSPDYFRISPQGRQFRSALRRVARGAAEAGHEVEKIRLAEKKVGYCTGCYACQKLNRCVQNDDANELAESTLFFPFRH